MRRGEIWWADLDRPRGSEPAFRRPVVILQDDDFNASAIATAVVVAITSNLRLAAAPGNLRLGKRTSGLGKASVVNVSQIATVDKHRLIEHVGRLSEKTLAEVEAGVELVLGLRR